jgi:hypothetical protein
MVDQQRLLREKILLRDKLRELERLQAQYARQSKREVTSASPKRSQATAYTAGFGVNYGPKVGENRKASLHGNGRLSSR